MAFDCGGYSRAIGLCSDVVAGGFKRDVQNRRATLANVFWCSFSTDRYPFPISMNLDPDLRGPKNPAAIWIKPPMGAQKISRLLFEHVPFCARGFLNKAFTTYPLNLYAPQIRLRLKRGPLVYPFAKFRRRKDIYEAHHGRLRSWR